MRLREEVVDLGERRVRVRELSVADVRAWLQRIDSALDETAEQDVDLVGELLLESMSLRELAMMTDLALQDMDALTPAELEQVVTVCRELNPHFFRVRQRLLRFGDGAASAPDSTPPSAP